MCLAVPGCTTTNNYYDYYYEADPQQVAQGGPATVEISGRSETTGFIIKSIRENCFFVASWATPLERCGIATLRFAPNTTTVTRPCFSFLFVFPGSLSFLCLCPSFVFVLPLSLSKKERMRGAEGKNRPPRAELQQRQFYMKFFVEQATFRNFLGYPFRALRHHNFTLRSQHHNNYQPPAPGEPTVRL